MRITISPFISFKMKYTNDRQTILKTKIDKLRECNISDIMIEQILYSEGYGMKEINNIL